MLYIYVLLISLNFHFTSVHVAFNRVLISAIWRRCLNNYLFIVMQRCVKYSHRIKRHCYLNAYCLALVTWSTALMLMKKYDIFAIFQPINRLYLETIHIYLYVPPGFRSQSSHVHDLDIWSRHYTLYSKSAFNYICAVIYYRKRNMNTYFHIMSLLDPSVKVHDNLATQGQEQLLI